MVVVQYGVPVSKIVSGISRLRKVQNGISGIKWALRSSHSAALIGRNVARVLLGLMGFDDAIREYSS